ncbi:uncharacterized protein LOC117071017 [Trachypithecus francoisi]|uniref:uncharacterized protein LOC117071017 n=1 Tax=Trachypithecus francoisi TaxID=54180 RepID=UPI00141AD942|nr:uncharacterized protein LOC117071017 [Trachypithecus francoisi]
MGTGAGAEGTSSSGRPEITRARAGAALTTSAGGEASASAGVRARMGARAPRRSWLLGEGAHAPAAATYGDPSMCQGFSPPPSSLHPWRAPEAERGASGSRIQGGEPPPENAVLPTALGTDRPVLAQSAALGGTRTRGFEAGSLLLLGVGAAAAQPLQPAFGRLAAASSAILQWHRSPRRLSEALLYLVRAVSTFILRERPPPRGPEFDARPLPTRGCDSPSEAEVYSVREREQHGERGEALP